MQGNKLLITREIGARTHTPANIPLHTRLIKHRGNINDFTRVSTTSQMHHSLIYQSVKYRRACISLEKSERDKVRRGVEINVRGHVCSCKHFFIVTVYFHSVAPTLLSAPVN